MPKTSQSFSRRMVVGQAAADEAVGSEDEDFEW